MEPNLRHPPKKMGKNDQRVDAQVDRPAVMGMCRMQLIKTVQVSSIYKHQSI